MHLALEAGMQRPALLCSKIRSVLWLFMWASADVPWPVGQSWPATCFCTAPVFRVGVQRSSGCCIAWALLHSLEAVLKDKDQSGCPWGTSCTCCLPGPHALAQIRPAGLCHCHFNKHWHFPYLFQTCWYRQPSYRADRIKLAFFNVHGSWKDIQFTTINELVSSLPKALSPPPWRGSSDEEIGCVTLMTHLISRDRGGMQKSKARARCELWLRKHHRPFQQLLSAEAAGR